MASWGGGVVGYPSGVVDLSDFGGAGDRTRRTKKCQLCFVSRNYFVTP